MKEKQWVQHISGTGEKYSVGTDEPTSWGIGGPPYYFLPKSAYRLCDPPEVWVDVTEQCSEISTDQGIPEHFSGGIGGQDKTVLFERNKIHGINYRLRKVRVWIEDSDMASRWAFIVEKEQP